jgi:2-polyprenyl-3-methyl-5-hydroxy-6-metoxy-1,4-benzoquinol methylase
MSLEEQLYNVAEFTFEHGEILKAYVLLKNAPLSMFGDEKLGNLMERVKNRLDSINLFQSSYRTDCGFAEPPDATKKAPYVALREALQEIDDVNYLVDVGCYSGWVGRNLSIWGYRVHGIDLDVETLKMAELMAVGTKATYELLEGTKVGEKYPETFDGAILFDVVEHVFDDKLLIQSVERSLRPGGWVFINLPKYDTPAQIKQGNTPDEIKEHLRAYGDVEMRNMFGNKKVNFKVLDDEGILSYFIWYQIGGRDE